jgi:hypothetical protein
VPFLAELPAEEAGAVSALVDIEVVVYGSHLGISLSGTLKWLAKYLTICAADLPSSTYSW